MGSPLRRRSAVAAALLLVALGCTGVAKVQDDAARPPSTAKPTATDNEKTVMADATKGKPVSVQLPDGARLSLPAGAVVSSKAQLSLTESSPGVYDAGINGEWQGRADVRLPVGAVAPSAQAFLLAKVDKGWQVEDAEMRPDGFLYASLPSLSLLKALSCNATVADAPQQVVNCLSSAGVYQVPDALARNLAAKLGCGSTWPQTALISRDAYCVSAPAQPSVPVTTGPTGGGSGAPAAGTTPPATPAPGTATTAANHALQVQLTEDPVRCDGSRRSFGMVYGAQPGETIQFSSAGIDNLLPGRADANGAVTVHWVCTARHVGWTWSLTAVGASSGRTITFDFHGGAGTP